VPRAGVPQYGPSGPGTREHGRSGRERPVRGVPEQEDPHGNGSADPRADAAGAPHAPTGVTPRAVETRVAVGLCLVLGAYFTYQFGASLLSALGVADPPGTGVHDPAYRGQVSSAEQVRHASGYTAAMLGFALVAGLPVTVGLWLRRQWARDAAYLVFGVTGFLATVVTLSGVLGDSGGRNAVVGLAVGLTLLAVTALVAAPACAADFDRVARDRDRGLAARRAANARRRAGSG
jgi:hypothetical protein